MRTIHSIKIAKVLSVSVMMAMLTFPLVSSAIGFTVPTAPGTDPVPGQTTITGIILYVIQILLAVAALVAVIFLIAGGFKYITAGGNEETAESGKKTITNAIIGIVVIILAFVIIRVIANALLTQTV